MEKYQKLRNEISKIEKEDGIAKFYSGALFSHTSWYTAGFETPKVLEKDESSPVTAPVTEKVIERPSAESSPKRNEVLSSLAEKIEETGALESKFGSIMKDSKSSNLGAQLKLSSDIESYKAQVEKIYDFRFDNFEGISTLIVGESKLDEFSSDNSYIKSAHDSSELLGKMIIPMKLEEGEFLRTSLIGRNDEEVLQNLLCEISVLRPKVVISLGAIATNLLYGKKEKLSKIHGQEIERVIELGGSTQNFTLFPIFHPDLLQINPSMKRTAWMDLQKVMKYLGKL